MRGDEKIDPEVARVLSNVKIDADGTVHITAQLGRTQYRDVNKVLELLGGKWKSGRTKGHVFAGMDRAKVAEMIDEVIVSGTITDRKKAFQFFPTPEAIAADMVKLAKIEPTGLRVLEPSAGNGRIADAIIAGGTYGHLDLVETQSDLAHALREKYECFESVTVTCCDFLQLLGDWAKPDRIIMNPPFAAQQDVDHVMHAWNMLRPGGVLVAIMSSSVTFRSTKKTAAFRVLLHEVKGSLAELPEDAFEESGTGVRTVLVRMEKPR